MPALTLEFAPIQLTPAAVGAFAYWRRARTLSERGHPVPAWRQWCWYGGVALGLATLVGLGGISDQLFLAHMVEHLLIADLGALLLVLGLTGPLMQPILAVPWLAWLRVFTHPVVALSVWSVDFYVWHLPVLYQGAVQNDWVHALEHMMFVACGMAMWMALLGPLPKPAWFGNGARLAYLLIAWVAGAALANGLLWASHPLYPHYAATAAAAGRGALADQAAAGGVMLVEQSAVVFALLGWLLARTLRDAGRRQELAELAARQGVALDARRIARAVAAEQDARLGERLRRGASADMTGRGTREPG
jgi:cytochrome c oxidase assembly factor CtaG